MNRRSFIHFLIAILASPALVWWLLVGKRTINYESKQERIKLGNEIPPGINFYGSVIVINYDGKMKAYEAKCTHLGCRISKAEGDTLVCPCHGSRYDVTGKAMKGPATESLNKLSIEKDPQSGEYFIEKM